jgi:hypothetical protein
MLKRIVRNLWRRSIGSCVSQSKRELAPWAGHVGLELGNVVANYPFEGRRDSWKAAEFTETISRLSCA